LKRDNAPSLLLQAFRAESRCVLLLEALQSPVKARRENAPVEPSREQIFRERSICRAWNSGPARAGGARVNIF